MAGTVRIRLQGSQENPPQVPAAARAALSANWNPPPVTPFQYSPVTCLLPPSLPLGATC